MLFRTIIILSTVYSLSSITAGLAAQEPPSDRTYIAFHSAPLAIIDSGLEKPSCFGRSYDEIIESGYAFAPIIVSFNSKPLILDVGYVKTLVPCTKGSLGVRVFGIGALNSYGSFFFSHGSTNGSYSGDSYYNGMHGFYWEEYSTSFNYSETLLSWGVTIKYSHLTKLQTRLYLGYGYRLYKEKVLHYLIYESDMDGDYDSGSEREYSELDTKTKTLEVSAHTLISMYGPLGIFFNFDILAGHLENTEIVKPGRITALFGVSCII